ncbi:hypothetical protein IG631_14892 [Alternaria alternata]|nr:hypothetical protein IG631_14892 [Alternaria alternata]
MVSNAPTLKLLSHFKNLTIPDRVKSISTRVPGHPPCEAQERHETPFGVFANTVWVCRHSPRSRTLRTTS